MRTIRLRPAGRVLIAACALFSCFAIPAQTRRALQRVPVPSGDVIVELRAGIAPSRDLLRRFREDVGAIPHSKGALAAPSLRIRREYSTVFLGAAVQAGPEALESIARLPYVRKIHPDSAVNALSTGTAHTAAGTARARIEGARGRGITVAVLDTGIDFTHPALGGGFGPGFKVAGGYDFVNGDADPMDDNGHGTHVAGIIAADAPEMAGIAPGATLLAYKVLDSYGVGRQSDVVAALERAVDPNGDGDPSDHADVANLSLGGTGTPDDPQSLAVDAASAAGVVVCVSAGNDGAPFSILSPGTARDAVTVGALSAMDEVAAFSSRGPTVKLTAIKPDVVAPGVGIESTAPGGGYATRDGTSMAAPQVAGACALIRELHDEWSPADVKSAITMTATPVAAGVMSRGAGCLNAAAAAASPLLASDSHFDFGLDADQRGTSRRSKSIFVANAGATHESYEITATSVDPAVVVRATPPRVDLPPGGAAMVTLALTIDTDVVIGDPSWVREGVVTLSSLRTSAHFAWAIVTASRAVLTVDQTYGSFFLLSKDAVQQPLWLSPSSAEVYVTSGEHRLVAIGYELDGLPKDVTFVSSRRIVAGDGAIRFTRNDAPHRIELRGENEHGAVLSRGGAGVYASRFRVYAPPPSTIPGIEVITRDGTLATSDLEGTFEIKAAEVGVDPSAHRVVSLQYPALSGAHDVILAASPSDLKLHRMRFVYAHGDALRQISIESVAMEDESICDPYATTVVAVEESHGAAWEGELYANEEAADAHPIGIVLRAAQIGHAADVATSVIRLRKGRFIASSASNPSAFVYSATDGEMVTYGDGPVVVAPHVVASPSSLHACARIVGGAGESRPRALENGSLAVFDAQGGALARSTGEAIDVSVECAGAYRVEITTQCLCTSERPMRASLVVDLDSRATDTIPPMVTSLQVVDSLQRLASSLAAGESGALLFSVHDDGDARALVPEATRAWFRRDAGVWETLTPIQASSDADGGVGFRTDIAPATAREGAVDLRIAVADVSGNTLTLTLEPAFTVHARTVRRRAVGTH